MKMQALIKLGIAVLVLCFAAFFGYQRWSGQRSSSRADVLAGMPSDASAVIFIDLDELRRAPFVEKLYAWAPKPQADADYEQFLKETAFDYERDLERIAIAVEKRGKEFTFFAVIDGKFDREKISAYASRSGAVAKSSGRDIFSVPVSGSPKRVSFTFLSKDRIALTDDADLSVFLSAKKVHADAAEWRARFERLAGSPIFAVIQQDAAAGTALAAQAPGGLRSPQLSTLLDQLQWITLAGKPENDRLRVVAEGECAVESSVRQLVDLLNGVMVLAEAGLNDARTRQHLDPAAREAYLELLKSADVSKIDRGDTKSVRLVLEITPSFLEAARTAPPTAAPDSTPNQPQPPKSSAQKKGHT